MEESSEGSQERQAGSATPTMTTSTPATESQPTLTVAVVADVDPEAIRSDAHAQVIDHELTQRLPGTTLVLDFRSTQTALNHRRRTRWMSAHGLEWAHTAALIIDIRTAPDEITEAPTHHAPTHHAPLPDLSSWFTQLVDPAALETRRLLLDHLGITEPTESLAFSATDHLALGNFGTFELNAGQAKSVTTTFDHIADLIRELAPATSPVDTRDRTSQVDTPRRTLRPSRVGAHRADRAPVTRRRGPPPSATRARRPAVSDFTTEFTGSPAPRASFGWAQRPVISFISVTFGTDDVVEQSLASLAQSIAGDHNPPVEVIIVDNPHPQFQHRTADRLALSTFGVQVIRPTRNLGFGGGNELGVLHARGELLCFINPDLIFSAGWLEPILEEVRSHPNAIVAPRLINADGSIQECGQQLLSNGHTRPITDDTTPPDYASAACWMMFRLLHERAGGFDSRFHPAYFEDVDFALRVRRLGGETRIADAEVVHLLGGSTADADTPPAEAQRSVLLELWADELCRQPIN